MGERINIQNLIDLLFEKKGLNKKDADLFLKEMFNLIEEALEKDKYLKIKGFGTFKLIEVDSRESVNVNTGERIEIQSHSKISFTPEASIRDQINRPFSHFETVILNDNTVFVDMPESNELNDLVDLDSEQSVEDDFSIDDIVEPIETKTLINPDSSISEIADLNIQGQVQSVNLQVKPQESTLLSDENKETTQEAIGLSVISETIQIEDHSSENADEIINNQNSTENVEISNSIQFDNQTEKPNEVSIIQDKLDSEVHLDVENKTLESENAQFYAKLASAAKIEDIEIERYANKNTIGFCVFVFLFLVVFIGGIFTYLYNPDLILNIFSSPTKEIPFESVVVPKDSDSIKMKNSDYHLLKEKTVAENQKNDTIHSVITGLDVINLTSQPDSTTFKIVGTMAIYKVKAGDNIIKISKKFYSSKNLWPYIIKHNKKLSNNPNNLSEGTTLTIPALRNVK